MAKLTVAVDGPSAAGKSTLAKLAAEKLGLCYLDTGAMYRAIAVYVHRNGVDVKDKDAVIAAAEAADVTVRYTDGIQHTYLNGEDVTDIVHDNIYSLITSNISGIQEVRDISMVAQRQIARDYGVIMDGRDIGTVVLPDADVKIFMIADVNVRAKRRFDELTKKGGTYVFEDVLEDLKQRDYNDTHRDVAPLKKADDAIELDTTYMTLDEEVEAVVALCKKVR